MNKYLQNILFVIIIFFGSTIQSQTKEPIKLFKKSDYADSVFTITSKQYSHGDITIRLTQVLNISSYSPFICRAWLNIEQKGRIIRQYYLNSIEPVGSYFGIFVPNALPTNNYFAVVKHGDYDGRLILIDKSGKMSQYMAGSYLVTKKKDYLFSEYYSDMTGIEVVDLHNGRSVFQSNDLPSITKWYCNNTNDNEKYFFTSDDVVDSIYVFNNKSKLFYSQPIDSLVIKQSVVIKYDFVPPNEFSCGCKDK